MLLDHKFSSGNINHHVQAEQLIHGNPMTILPKESAIDIPSPEIFRTGETTESPVEDEIEEILLNKPQKFEAPPRLFEPPSPINLDMELDPDFDEKPHSIDKEPQGNIRFEEQKFEDLPLRAQQLLMNSGRNYRLSSSNHPFNHRKSAFSKQTADTSGRYRSHRLNHKPMTSSIVTFGTNEGKMLSSKRFLKDWHPWNPLSVG